MEKKHGKMKKQILLFFFAGAFCLAGCKRQFDPINYGHEACTHCRMTIMDKRFAAEIITSKGRAIKFDDFGCLLGWVKEENFSDPGAMIFVADFNHPGGDFLDARHAVFIHDETLRSPMNGNFAATASEIQANQLNKSAHSQILTWINLSK
jgi:copper chaperone NosL